LARVFAKAFTPFSHGPPRRFTPRPSAVEAPDPPSPRSPGTGEEESMDAILDLFRVGEGEERAETAPAARLQRASGEVRAALAIGALWGAAAGSVSARLAAANLYKVPMVMLLSSLSSLPLGLYAWSALARERDGSTFVAAQARSLLRGAMVLGVSAP